MASEKRIISLLGIAKKAGKVISGTDMTVESVRSERKDAVKLFLLASDASANTLKRIENTGAYYGIPIIKLSIDKTELARVTGKRSELSVVGITDEGFVSAMMSADL